jgi:hypothetical protein
MDFQFTVAQSMLVPVWDEETRRNAKSYWQNRRVIFIGESDRILRGRRSNLLTNLVAFDPSKIAANLTITWMEPGHIDCVLTLNTTFQWLTEWSKAFLRLEMATFESYLLYGDLNGEVWETFLRSHDIANLKWAASGGILGNNMSDADRKVFLTQAVKRIACRPAA